MRKYRKGKTSSRETGLIDDWYESFGEVFPEKDLRQRKILRNELHARIQERISPGGDVPARSIRKPRRYLLPAAAAALVLATVGLGLWRLHTGGDPAQPHENTQQWVTVIASSGKLKKVQLPDSSMVWLNAGSTLRFASPFGKENRRIVMLEQGEAFFEVTPDPSRPFVVRSGDLSTRVLGTSFNVKAYAELDEMMVSVLTGKVEVSQSDSRVLGVLHHGDELTYRRSTRTADVRQVSTDTRTSWITGKTQLRQASFEELAVVLRYAYGIQLQAGNDAVAAQRYSMPLSRDLSLDRLIEVICNVHDNQYRKEGDVIIIF